MRRLAAFAAILVVVVAVATGYEGGRWIGSLVDIGLDHSAPLVIDDAEEAERAQAQAVEARARAEAVRRAAEGRVLLVDPAVDAARDAWLERVGDRCVHWASMTEDEKVGTADMLTAHLIETVRTAQQLPSDATHAEVLVDVAASIDNVCEESPPERELIEVTISLYGD